MNPLLLILLLPILEIVGFIQVGDWIGAGPTIGLLALSALVGMILVRHQGLGALTRAQAAAARGEAPIGTVLDGFCAVLAGILLIIPGFLTDLLGLALLVPPLRRGLGRWLLGRIGGGLPVFTTDPGAGFGRGRGAAGFEGFDGPATDPFRPGRESGHGPSHSSSHGPSHSSSHGPSHGHASAPGVIDGDYRDVTADEQRADGQDGRTAADAPRLSDSQWGKHRPDERG